MDCSSLSRSLNKISFILKIIIPTVLLLFKLSIVLSTVFTVIKTGVEYSCLQSRPGTVYNLKNINDVQSFQYSVESNSGGFWNCKDLIGIKGSSLLFHTTHENYVKIDIQCVENVNLPGRSVMVNFQGISIISDLYGSNGTAVFNLITSVLSQECSMEQKTVNYFFFLYLFIMSFLTFDCFLVLGNFKLKSKNFLTIWVTEATIDMFKFFSIKLHKDSGFCYLKNNKRYLGGGINCVQTICQLFPGKQTPGHDEYDDYDFKYILVGSKLFVVDQTSVFKNEILLDFNDDQITNLRDVFWFYKNLGFPAVLLDHCLELRDILDSLRFGSFFIKNSKKGFFLNSSFDFYFLKNLYLFSDKNLLMALIKHNEDFFKDTNGNSCCLNKAVSGNLRFFDRPESCKNSKWKYYCSDVSYILMHYGIYYKGIEARKMSVSVTNALSNKKDLVNKIDFSANKQGFSYACHPVSNSNVVSVNLINPNQDFLKKEDETGQSPYPESLENEVEKTLNVTNLELENPLPHFTIKNEESKDIPKMIVESRYINEKLNNFIFCLIEKNLDCIKECNELNSDLDLSDLKKELSTLKTENQALLNNLPFTIKSENIPDTIKIIRTLKSLSNVKKFQSKDSINDCLVLCKPTDRRRAIEGLKGNELNLSYKQFLENFGALNGVLQNYLRVQEISGNLMNYQAEKHLLLRNKVIDFADEDFFKKFDKTVSDCQKFIHYSETKDKVSCPDEEAGKKISLNLNSAFIKMISNQCAVKLRNYKTSKLSRMRQLDKIKPRLKGNLGTVIESCDKKVWYKKPKNNSAETEQVNKLLECFKVKLDKGQKNNPGFVHDKLLMDFSTKMNKLHGSKSIPLRGLKRIIKVKPYEYGSPCDSTHSICVSLYLGINNLMLGNGRCKKEFKNLCFNKKFRFVISKSLDNYIVGNSLIDKIRSERKDMKISEKPIKNLKADRQLITALVLKEFYGFSRGEIKTGMMSLINEMRHNQQ